MKRLGWQRTALATLIVLIIGGAILWFGWWLPATSGWRIVAFNIGSFVVASVAMALIFQFWQLRGLLEELAEKAGITEEIKRARLLGFTTSRFHQNVPWPDLLQSSSHIRITVAYARSWRANNQGDLESFLGRKGTHLEVLMPDPDCAVAMEEMALRFGYRVEELTDHIRGAIEDLTKMAQAKGGNLALYLFARSLTYTSYLFDSRVVFTSYRHVSGRGRFLTLQGARGGELYEWLEEEWTGVVEGSETKQVHP